MKQKELRKYAEIAYYMLWGFIIGLVAGFIIAAISIPPEVIIIKEIPPETLPGIILE